MAQLKPEDAATSSHARMSSLNIKLSYSIASETGDDDENEFKTMIQDTTKMVENLDIIHKTGQNNFAKVLKEINSTFDQIQAIVEQQRKDLIKQVADTAAKKHANLDKNGKEFDQLLVLLNKYSDNVAKSEIKQEMDCERKMKELIYDTLVNDCGFQLTCDLDGIKANLAKMVNVTTLNNNVSNYQMCGFDEDCIDLTGNSKVGMYKEYIKIGKNSGHCYASVKCGKDLDGIVNGYQHGEHCWRLYYRNAAKKADKWLFFGISEFAVKPNDKHSYGMDNTWGVAGFDQYRTYHDGTQENDNKMSFLYENTVSMVDMFVDFDKSVIIYKIVSNDNNDDKKTDDDDDDLGSKEYKLEGFSGDVSYWVHLNLYSPQTEVQIAKIDVRMFGKEEELVSWPTQYQD